MTRRYTKLELEKIERTLHGRLSEAFSGAYDKINTVKELNLKELKETIKNEDINDLIQLDWKDFYIQFNNNRNRGHNVELRIDYRNQKLPEFSEMYADIMEIYDRDRLKIEPLRKAKMQEIEEFVLKLIMGEELDELTMPTFDDIEV